MLLGQRLNRLPATEALLRTDRDRMWLQDAVSAGVAFQVVVEFLRSRLPGYPVLRVPHIRRESPHVSHDPFFVAGFPWDLELRRLGLQLKEPPDMTRVGAVHDCRNLLWNLVRGLESRPAWRRFGTARDALTGADVDTLGRLGKEFAARLSDEAITAAAGHLLLSEFRYRKSVLCEVVASAEGAASEYLTAFQAVDELITFVASLVETLLTSDGLLTVQPYRMDVGSGVDLRPVELAIFGGAPHHPPGAILMVQAPSPVLSGLVYPTAITHKWERLPGPRAVRMIVTGEFAAGSG
jgi:hypothetical protein